MSTPGKVTRSRMVKKKETLELAPCPICLKSSIVVRDCGYTTFNPGTATCADCGESWELGWVDDAFDAGIAWNAKQPSLTDAAKLAAVKAEIEEREKKRTAE